MRTAVGIQISKNEVRIMKHMAKKKIIPFERKKRPSHTIFVKIGGATWPINPNFFQDVLVGLGYQNIASADDRSVRGVKSNYAFSSSAPELSFWFDSDRGNILIDAQREFFAVLARDYKVHIEDYIAYYRFRYTCEYILDESVDTTYGMSLENTSVKPLFESAIGRKLMLNKLEMSPGCKVDVADWHSMEISTRVESSGNTLFCNMIRMSNSQQEIHKTARDASGIVDKLVDDLTTRQDI